MKLLTFLVFSIIASTGCQSQEYNESDKGAKQTVGGPCEICHLYSVDMPQQLSSIDTSSLWAGPSTELMITGQVFERDGKTPAADVILFYWHTNKEGIYPTPPKPSVANRLGSIKGWLKTDKQGRYTLYTTRPAPYPNGGEPAHIHWLIKESNLDHAYYIDAMVFDDDSLLTSEARKGLENRGGSMVLRPVMVQGKEVAEKNIILGLNIPGYYEMNDKEASGLPIGFDSPSFTPFHAYGPDAGSRVCPVCKYGRYHGILYFVGGQTDWNDVDRWLTFLERESRLRAPRLKVYFIYGGDDSASDSERTRRLQSIGERLNLNHVALTHVPTLEDVKSDVHLNQINPDVTNTFIIYRQRNIIDKFIAMEATKDNFNKLKETLNLTLSPYFDYPETWTLQEKN